MARSKYIYVVYMGVNYPIGYFTVKHEAISYAEEYQASHVFSYPDGGHDEDYVAKLVWENELYIRKTENENEN